MILFFLIFTTFYLKIFTSIIDDSYDNVKMNDNYNWIDNSLKIEDYLKNEILKEVNTENEDEEGQKIDHYLLSNIFLQLLMERENEARQHDRENSDLLLDKNKGSINCNHNNPNIFLNKKPQVEYDLCISNNENFNRFKNFECSNKKSNEINSSIRLLDQRNSCFINAENSVNNPRNYALSYTNNSFNFMNSHKTPKKDKSIDHINFILKKNLKKIKKETLSKSFLSSALNLNQDDDLNNISLITGNTASGKIKLYYKYSDAYINNIFNSFKKINLIISISKKDYLKKLSKKEIEELTNHVIYRTDAILRKIQQIKFQFQK